MLDYLLPALYALFVWWFSTGAIIYLDGLPQRTFRWSILGATLVLAGSLYGLSASSTDVRASGAYVAFTCGLLVWGWLEITFYMGVLSGPRRVACAQGCSGWRHFGHALQVSLYHEIAILAAAAGVVALTWDGENRVGMWTFIVLWWMHQSARLNVFLGVPNLNEHFLPEHLQYLKSFFNNKPMNLLFPISVTVSTVVTAWLIQKAISAPAGSVEVVSFTFLASMMALAVLEHWFLVIPMRTAGLWDWGMKSRPTTLLAIDAAPARPDTALTSHVHEAVCSHPRRSMEIARPSFSQSQHEGCVCMTKSANGRQV